MDKIVLYRGDSTKIRQFDFSKTDKHCLIGQGIYLTNKATIAETYRTKTSYAMSSSDICLLNDKCATKGEANEKAFAAFRDLVLKTKRPSNTDILKFEDAVMNGNIIVKEQIKYVNSQRVRWFEYTYVADSTKRGYITTFEFPRKLFEDSMYFIDTYSHDHEILRMFWESRCFVQQWRFGPGAKPRTYVRANAHRANITNDDVVTTFEDFTDSVRRFGMNLHCLDYERVRKQLEPFGYQGLEYRGGVRLGGGHNHRAFCVWPDEFVNEHKVLRHY